MIIREDDDRDRIYHCKPTSVDNSGGDKKQRQQTSESTYQYVRSTQCNHSFVSNKQTNKQTKNNQNKPIATHYLQRIVSEK